MTQGLPRSLPCRAVLRGLCALAVLAVVCVTLTSTDALPRARILGELAIGAMVGGAAWAW
jgi:hypothetical protein